MAKRLAINVINLVVLLTAWSIIDQKTLMADQCCDNSTDCGAYGNNLACCLDATPDCEAGNHGTCKTLDCDGHICYGRGESCSSSADCCFYPCNVLGKCDSECLANDSECPGAFSCCSGYCDANSGVCKPPPSPILINLRNDGLAYDLTSAADGVMFDIDADGVLDRVSWTDPNSDIAFLALDRNGNGAIDDGAELFGTATRKLDGSLAANGFEALLDMDSGPGESDGKIDYRDLVYGQLRLWIDRNHNGLAEASELRSLADANVAAIMTSYSDGRRTDRYGNQYRYKGTVLIQHRKDLRPRTIFDVVLVKGRNATTDQ